MFAEDTRDLASLMHVIAAWKSRRSYFCHPLAPNRDNGSLCLLLEMNMPVEMRICI